MSRSSRARSFSSLLLVGLAACAADASEGPELSGSSEAVKTAKKSITLSPLGTYSSGLFNQAAAEITAHDPVTQRLFVVNATNGKIDVLDVNDPTTPTLIDSIDLSALGAGANSVAMHDGLLAVAIEGHVKQDPGTIAFFNADGTLLNALPAGALPDMIKFTPNGRYVLTANEGEPNATYTVDPEGSVSIVDVSGCIEDLDESDVVTADFRRFNGTTLDPSVRIFGPNATVAQDLEPEYIAVDQNSKTAYVTMQENNAIAIVDIRRGRVIDIVGLGFKDHSLPGNGFDASDRDTGVNIANWPTKGMYMPDAIAALKFRGDTYLLTVNEGDAREYGTFIEEVRINSSSYVLDPTTFPNAAFLKQDANLGRLRATSKSGDTDGDGDFDVIHTFGARSMTTWDSRIRLVNDTGDEMERVTAAAHPANFNASHDNNTRDARSPSKGPEPEALAIGKVAGRTYAFAGLERISGLMVYDVTDPRTPVLVEYVNERDFSQAPASGLAGDLGPEGILFIEGDDSPTGEPLLVVSNEVSGSVTLYEIQRVRN
jgi:hypothetical protein